MKLLITQTSKGRSAQLTQADYPLNIIYATRPPGGPFGFYGPDVCELQSVAVRFIPRAGHHLKKLGLWFMNNGQANTPIVRVSIQNDRALGQNSMPGGEILEEWKFKVSAIGWDPAFEELDAEKSPYLEAGVPYWIVAESEASCSEDGVWVIAADTLGFSTVTNEGIWQPGEEGAVPSLLVWGMPPVN